MVVVVGSTATDKAPPPVFLTGMVLALPSGFALFGLNGIVAVPPAPMATNTNVLSGDIAIC